MTPEELARRITGWARGRPAPAVVALDGPSGAGKTHLAAALVSALPGAVAVHLDDLYPGWDGLDAVVPIVVEHVLAALPRAGRIVVPSWNWQADAPGPPRELPELGPPRPPVLLLEGAGAGARACAPYLAGLVWVEAPEEVRRERALARDGETYAPHWERWAAQERTHADAEGTRARADLVLDTAQGAQHAIVVRAVRR